MHNSIIVLLPPLIVLISAFITRRLNPSLLLGVISAGFIAANFSPWGSSQLIFSRFIEQITDIDNLLLYAFLLMIGVLITLIGRTGGATAFGRAITRHIKNGTMVETATIMFSSVLCIDDYLSSLTVGYVMQPLTDQYRIPRAKLAFLAHSLAGPMVVLMPISGWISFMTAQLNLAGIDTDAKILMEPFFAYLSSLPFMLYSFGMIASTWFIVRAGISYGAMKKHEEIAQKEGNFFGGKDPIIRGFKKSEVGQGTIWDLLVPLISLISFVLIGMPLMQSFFSSELVLCLSVLGALVISIVFATIRSKLSTSTIPTIFAQGSFLMSEAVVMVVLASILGTMLKSDLFTGHYLAHALLGSISIAFLPAMFFGISVIIATITGSSWGTMALMLPIAVPMLTSFTGVALPTAPANIPLLFPLLGAIFSGSVCGDQISPISETTIMASTSSGCYPLDHAYTQAFYAIPAIIWAAIGFVLCGFLTGASFWLQAAITSAVTVIGSCLTLYVLSRLSGRIK